MCKETRTSMPFVKAHSDDNQEKRGTNNPVKLMTTSTGVW